ncbi:glutamate--tRNA ligase [Flavobacteriaceae bacterium]|nr:glutamate--tRNA ligase [Flavobacteriaceae bacterium]
MERVRFAPSPTGPLHIGGLRTALFNYLYARKHGGIFVLRVEDTDQNRKVDNSEAYIHESLSWTGISPDEDPIKGGKYGPYRQSERKDIYQKHILELIENGKAYYAFDSGESLGLAREKDEKEKGGFKYNAQNRMLFDNSLTNSKEETANKLKEGNVVIRLKVDADTEVMASDLVRGSVRVNSNELEDKILMKKDGMPTYHFANVVDDYLMKITTVIRGEEWLPSLPIHQLLYDAFGWNPPKFMHLPLILNPSGKGKLSKRDGDKNGYPVFPIQWNETLGYRETGFLPEAHLNYIAQLGWSPKREEELMTLAEMEKEFDVANVQKGGARFDFEKAKWINQQHLASITADELINRFPAIVESLKDVYGGKTATIVDLVKERLVLMNDLEKATEFFLKDPEDYDEKSMKRIDKFDVKTVLELISESVKENELSELKDAFVQKGEANGIGLGAFMQMTRIAIVGGLSGPDLFSILEVLGKDVTLRRLERLINTITL